MLLSRALQLRAAKRSKHKRVMRERERERERERDHDASSPKEHRDRVCFPTATEPLAILLAELLLNGDDTDGGAGAHQQPGEGSGLIGVVVYGVEGNLRPVRFADLLVNGGELIFLSESLTLYCSESLTLY